MKKSENKVFSFYRFDHLAGLSDVLHFVSSGDGSLGFQEWEDPGIIAGHRKNLAEAVGFSPDRLTTAQQIHSDRIAVVTEAEAGRGAWDKESRLPDTDALVTDVPGICLMVMSADCVPVLLCDPLRKVIAAVHAGWRGTAAGIAGKTVALMKERFGSEPGDILAGIGPSIGCCCFGVGDEVAEVFRNACGGSAAVVGTCSRSGKSHVDLWEANRQNLENCGVRSCHIETAGICTVCGSENFFSYRREGQAAGRFGAGIMLTGDTSS